MADLLTVKVNPVNGRPFIPLIDISPSATSQNSSHNISSHSHSSSATSPPPPLFCGPPQGNVRRSRYNFSPEAVHALEEEFLANPYPDHARRETLSHMLNVSEARIHTWFTNKRARTKKVIRKRDDSPASKSTKTSVEKQLPVYVPARKRTRHNSTSSPSPAKKRQCTSPLSSAPSFMLSPVPSAPSQSTTASAFLPYHFPGMYCLPITSSPLLAAAHPYPPHPYWMIPTPLTQLTTPPAAAPAAIVPTHSAGRCSPHPIGFLPKDAGVFQRSVQGSDSGYISHEEDSEN